ncbi:MAG: phosphoribosylaminoimidazolecarboxamide formyltransferase/IMP cyclohydrolase [Bacteroidia bacterium]|jgi:phosphoribosylaminoimidazolecarboxamide formyltransferase/IMP cyclohydrolase
MVDLPLPQKILKAVKTALISVFYKDQIDQLVHFLHSNGVTILSTGGTQTYLENLGIPVVAVETLTNYPSILGGRVKTLHPGVFGGILNRSDNASDAAEMDEFDIRNIDLICVDLYPFEETVLSGASEEDVIEKIDIGGVSLIRAAAKNFNDKIIISEKNQYDLVLVELKKSGCSTNRAFRKDLAMRAFEVTKMYDSTIFNYFSGDEIIPLRYGENPHQKATFHGKMSSIFDQIHGKALSYNNLLDVDAALNLVDDFRDEAKSVFGIFKHNNACGFAIRNTIEEAYAAALQADPVSAFGGVLATYSTVNKAAAEQMNSLFFEVIMAPEYSEEALGILRTKKNRIILKIKDVAWKNSQMRSILNGNLVQDRDTEINPIHHCEVVTDRKPSDAELSDLHFARILVKNTKSNAIVLAKNNQLLAAGTGQTSRVDALKQAIEKAKNFGFDLKGCAMASDAFFPFPDCVEIADNEGITSVIQPGGSIKDQLSVDYCNANNIAMVMTGKRHFKH